MNTDRPNSDLSFITNEGEDTLQRRFGDLLRDSQTFDCLIAYFYASGFDAVYPYLQDLSETRILAGMGVDARIVRAVHDARDHGVQQEFDHAEMSHAQIEQRTNEFVNQDIADESDTESIDRGIRRLLKLLDAGKLQVRVHRDPCIHSKLYIMTFKEGDRDKGRVITGSSNLTRGGLIDNLEFNVELKNRGDYDFAKQKFDQLWQDGVDVTKQYQEAIRRHVWVRDELSPYELYLKFLYEYFKEDLASMDQPLRGAKYYPKGFKDLEYQRQAVINAQKILAKYGGVFLSDVVGLGKTYMAAMLAKELDGRNLVIAPPALLRSGPGSWERVLEGFHVPARCESLGKLDAILANGVEMYDNVFIDEAHRFRNDQTPSYSDLMQICRGKRVILVTATPYNNKPNDVLSLLKLFQLPHQSTVPNVRNLAAFFKRQEKEIRKYDRQRDPGLYMDAVKRSSKNTREQILRHVMVRRTRKDIETNFDQDTVKGKLKFPKVNNPERLYYYLGANENRIFDKTLECIGTSLTYARYRILLYNEDETLLNQLERQGQENLGVFMKILLLKRLESSFEAFKQSINRFLHIYEQVIKAYQAGHVYISKDYPTKLYELIAGEDIAEIEELVLAGKADEYPAKDFRPALIRDLEHDHQILSQIKTWWQDIQGDPKLTQLVKELAERPTLQENRIIIFTEFRETAAYLHREIQQRRIGRPLLFTGDSSDSARDLVLRNFDATATQSMDEHNILISTDVLSEGVNLHRANVVINYDLPWNPTRMMQRVGRINRLDAPADQLHTFNFFPTPQSEKHLGLEALAKGKIEAFLNLLGGDTKLLTEDETITSHTLFERLGDAKTITGEDEEEGTSELKYLQVIRQIAKQDPELLAKIKRLPLKARSVKTADGEILSQAQMLASASTTPPKQGKIAPALLTYFRRGSLHKFFLTQPQGVTNELPFILAAPLLACPINEPRGTWPEAKWFYNELGKNKDAFQMATSEFKPDLSGSRDGAARLLDLLKLCIDGIDVLTKEEEEYMQLVMDRLDAGSISKYVTRKAYHAIEKLKENIADPRKVIVVLRGCIPDGLLTKHYSEQEIAAETLPEIILSLCLLNKEDG